MKFNLIYLLPLLSFFFVSCDEDETTTVTETVEVNADAPIGDFTAVRSGALVAQNSTPTEGDVALGTDSRDISFLQLGSNFKTNQGTGTVTVYFSTSMEFKADPANGNPDLQLVGAITKDGEDFFKLNGAVDSKFTHVILWCASANIPFGYAEIK